MYVLGINAQDDTSAALVEDGRVVFAAMEERYSRIKKDRSFPRLAIRAALDHAGIGPEDLDAVAFAWNRPGTTTLHTLRQVAAGQLTASRYWTLEQGMKLVSEIYRGGDESRLHQQIGSIGRAKVLYIDHHESHAWSAYGLSGFDEALVLVADGRGARQATTIYRAKGDQLVPIRTHYWPNSIGAVYAKFTDLLGFEPYVDEWKVMGLAAYGKPQINLDDYMRVGRGRYRVASKKIYGRDFSDLSGLTSRFGPRRSPETRIASEDKDLAASVQKATEDAIFELVREAVRITGCRRLCIAGGVGMNSKANGRLLASGLIDDLFVQPAATDDGAAIGAALSAHTRLGLPIPRYRLEDVYLGPEFTDEEAYQAISSFKLPATRVDAIEPLVARLLASGAIVGWFQGRMEFGPRALGNRSILADARRPEMKDRVNESVKFREGWRPFAPSCLEEAAGDYFEGCKSAPFMIVTYSVKPDKRSVIPAVTHVDDTARVQTVSKATNPRYWCLINEFAKLTGVPVIMNTSFNLRGEPIVCTPRDAIRTFYSSGLDYLVLGNYLLAKSPESGMALHAAPSGEARQSELP